MRFRGKANLREAQLGNGEKRLERIPHPIVSGNVHVHWHLNHIVSADVAVEELAKFRELEAHAVPDARGPLLPSNCHVLRVLLPLGDLREVQTSCL